MARRRQTTGLPKKSRKDNNEQSQDSSFLNRLLGNPSNRAEYEEALNKLLQRSILGFLGAIAAIIAIFLLIQYLYVPYVIPVATVNGEKITVREFRERVRFEQGLVLQQLQARYGQAVQFFGEEQADQFLQQDQEYQQWLREYQLVDILGQRVLDDMINDVLIRQEADERSISINEEAIQNQENDFFGYDPTQVALIGTPATETPVPTQTNTPFVSPTPTNTPLPTATPTAIPEATEDPEATAEVTAEATAEATAEIAASATIPPSPTPSQEDRLNTYEESVDLFRKNLRESANIGNSTIDAFFERNAIRDALIDAVVTTDATAPFVNARHILVDTEEEANEIITALQNGESFAALAQARSTDTQSGQRGGELDWSAAGGFVPAFEAAVLEAPIGEIVGPIESEFGFHVIQVRAREERDIEGTERDNLRQAEFAGWLTELREANEENITTNSNWPNFLPTN